MAKWKELGEVPDSDEESGLDSQEIQRDTLLQDEVHDRRDEPARSKPNIWDVPFSSQGSEGGHVEVRALYSHIPSLPPESQVHELHEPHSDPVLATNSTQIASDDADDKTRTVDQEQCSVGGVDKPVPARQTSPIHFVGAIFEVQQGPHDEANSQRPESEPTHLARSLRPRKPIQEHPYLLEGAQYSKALKSHGVRPLRMQIEEAQRKRQEEDSQDQDYEEESQEISKDLPPDDTEESQGAKPAEWFEDDGEIQLPRAASGAPSPEQTRNDYGGSFRSSQDDDDEFPDPADVEKWKSAKATRPRKRLASPEASSKAKKIRVEQPVRATRVLSPLLPVDDIFDIPPSPPPTSPALVITTPMTMINHPRPVTTITPKPSSTISSRMNSPAPADRNSTLIDLTSMDDGLGYRDRTFTSSESESESELEVVRVAKRMRGVLPASWLRLDQGVAGHKARKVVRQYSLEPSPERSLRKGVAQRRQTSPNLGDNAGLFIDHDSDDEGGILRLDMDDPPAADPIPIFGDDADSVIEDNQIDRMLPGNKRRNDVGDGLTRPKKRRRHQISTFGGLPKQYKRQQKITGHMKRARGMSTNSHVDSKRLRGSMSAGRRTQSVATVSTGAPSPPPQLSILDVIEFDAPPFIRIAARTARSRSNKGKSSPARKQIRLGTRQDNIDAIGTLNKWKRGTLRPKTRGFTAAPTPAKPSKPLDAMSSNIVPQPIRTAFKSQDRQTMPSTRFSQPRRIVKQASMNDFVNISSESAPARAMLHCNASLGNGTQLKSSSSRPAQLEMMGEEVGLHAFDQRKRTLDALYRRSRHNLPPPTAEPFHLVVDRHLAAQPSKSPPDLGSSRDSDSPRQQTVRTRTRLRKKEKPRSVDINAPQYIHANDPLPREVTPVGSVPNLACASKIEEKLLGLGPFGTHYTQHFEIFPLDAGVYFHESTFIGSRRLIKTTHDTSLADLCRPRGRCTFVLDEKILQWGPWNAQVSSELGIVCDWILDHLQSSEESSLVVENPKTATQATDFILAYLQDSISFKVQEDGNLFANRMVEVLETFQQRITTLANGNHRQSQLFIEVLTRSLVINLQCLRICQKSDHLAKVTQLEELLRNLAKTTARRLLDTNLASVRSLYDELQRTSFRDKGIRNEQYVVTCWVTLMRVLEEASILRSGFWDIVSPLILGNDASSVVDAHTFEEAWHSLFTLLPLGEFDNAGVVLTRQRYTSPLEGWSIPQRILKRVFELYRSSPQQSPSFNDYCRGLLTRCHYLVEQWGWRKCNSIIGTIFDFFAAQQLSHLRNEEAYKSPDFLEQLACSPSLSILPKDRCFHIFLKLLAQSIQRLRKSGSVKDLRNLATRVLPNHNRLYDREKNIHENELAALRNHHDLLCTLVWACPPDLRPSVATIEKLVMPESSHKEACLISLRSCSQLARFVVSSSEDKTAYKPYAQWQQSIFMLALDQYSSVESDMQQQFFKMSKTSRIVSEDMLNMVIKMNKRGFMDVLHFSMKAFMDIMRYTPTLAAASFALNHYPLDQFLSRDSLSNTDSDWSGLRAGIDILDNYLKRVEEFARNIPTNADHLWHGEDAIMLLERKLARPFFAIVRKLVVLDSEGPVRTKDRDSCLERIVAVAGRFAACLIQAKLSRVSNFFVPGKYQMFEDLLKPTSLSPRKYLPLFLAMLVDCGVTDFKDVNATSLDVLLVEIVKPVQFQAYENALGASMKRSEDPYLKDAPIEAGESPNYNSNRGLFGAIIIAMRKKLRTTNTSQKQEMQTQFSRALRSTMDRMKLGLKSLDLDNPEHMNYIEFVRCIVALIRSQDLCPIDPYFYQISREYAPSRQDPRLQTAGIVSWGLKLEEADSRAVPGLFYLLFPNFKLALADDRLPDEAKILEEGMRNPYVFSFMLGKMLPAIIQTATLVPGGWVLLETYVEAFKSQLSMACVYREIGGNDMTSVLTLVKSILSGVQHLGTLQANELHPAHLVTLRLVLSLLNLVAPSITAFLFNDAKSNLANALTETMDAMTDFTRIACAYISELLRESNVDRPVLVNPSRLFEGVEFQDTVTMPEGNEHVDRFAKHMIQDIQDNWISNDSFITVRGPSRYPSATQCGQGTPLPLWRPGDLLRHLNAEARAWNHVHDATTTSALDLPFDEYLF